MQKIFVNAKVLTLDKAQPQAEAFLVNDYSFAFVGTNKEILEMKNSQTEVVDLEGNYVLPALCAINVNKQKLAEFYKKLQKTEKENEILSLNLAFDKILCDYTCFKSLFLLYQEECLSCGITTIWFTGLDDTLFGYFEKFIKEKILKLDVIGYVDIQSNKDIMDNNCRSLRKYHEHFRLGGYSLNLDGSLADKRAWLSKPYKQSKGFVGYGNIVDEQLIHYIKTVAEEKKQLIVFANGDRAVDQFLRCLNKVLTDKKYENYRTLLCTSAFLSKPQLEKIVEFKIGIFKDLTEYNQNYLLLKKYIGARRVIKSAKLKRLIRGGESLLIGQSEAGVANPLQALTDKTLQSNKLINKQKFSADEILKFSIFNAAYYSFEDQQKGSIEIGKSANFIVFKENPIIFSSKPAKTYINGGCINN